MKPTPDFHVTPSFKFDESFDLVAREVEAVQNAVGLCEVSGFNRFEITGAGKYAFLDRMFCGRVTQKVGRVGLGYLLNHHGLLKGEATVANLPKSDRGPERVWYGSAAAAEFHDMDWLKAHLRSDEDVQIRSLTNDQTILVVAGPRARAVMSAVSREDWSAGTFPWLSVRECFVGFAPATVMGVSFSGELAYEVHVPNASLFAAYTALRDAGAEYGMQIFGARAVESMRLEKGFLHWKADILTEFDPFETGLDRFVKMEKANFIGKAALERRMADGKRAQLVSMELDSTDAAAQGGSSVMVGNEVIGTVTSGDWGHRVGKNLAYAFIKPDWAAIGTAFEVDVLGKRVAAKVIASSPYDPELALMRS